MKRNYTALVLITVLLLSFVLTGCTNPLQRDPKKLFTEATQNMKALDSIEVAMSVNLSMTYGGITEDGTSQMDIKMQNIQNPDKTIMDFTISMNVLDKSRLVKEYIRDGYIYTDTDGFKTKKKMDIDQVMGMFDSNIFSADALKSVNVSKQDGETVLDYTMDGDKITSLLDELMPGYMPGNLTEILGDIGFTYGDATGTVRINRDTMITYQSVDTTVKVSVDDKSVTMPMQMEITYVDPGKDVTVTLPDDLDEYK